MLEILTALDITAPLLFSEKNRRDFRSIINILPADIVDALHHMPGSWMKEGKWLALKPPSPEVEKNLLFFEPPFEITPDYNYVYDATNDVVPPQIPDSGKFGDLPRRFLEKAWNKIRWFRSDESPPMWQYRDLGLTPAENPEPYITAYAGIKPLRNRFGYNFQNAISSLIDGYEKDDKRRTGEPKWIHPIRNFFRLSTTWIPRSAADAWIAYVSDLAMLLHDAKEDFADFSIEKTDNYHDEAGLYSNCFRYNLSFNIDGQSFRHEILLTEQEEALLRLQIDAFTIPVEAVDQYRGEPQKLAQTQFAHLRKKSEEILALLPEQQGILAALYTLRGKVEDRRDNLFTYWTLGEAAEGSKTKLRKKLASKVWETITYVRNVELFARELYLLLPPTQTPLREYVGFMESAVRFGYFLLLGGTYDEAFIPAIENFHNERAEALKEGISNFDLIYDLIICESEQFFSTYVT